MAERTMPRRRIVQAEGFEVLDSEGRVRLALGHLGDTPDGDVWGLTVRGADGGERAWVVASGPRGCEMGLLWEGNVVARLQVTDEGEAIAYLAGTDGVAVAEWSSFDT